MYMCIYVCRYERKEKAEDGGTHTNTYTYKHTHTHTHTHTNTHTHTQSGRQRQERGEDFFFLRGVVREEREGEGKQRGGWR